MNLLTLLALLAAVSLSRAKPLPESADDFTPSDAVEIILEVAVESCATVVEAGRERSDCLSLVQQNYPVMVREVLISRASTGAIAVVFKLCADELTTMGGPSWSLPADAMMCLAVSAKGGVTATVDEGIKKAEKRLAP